VAGYKIANLDLAAFNGRTPRVLRYARAAKCPAFASLLARFCDYGLNPKMVSVPAPTPPLLAT
jgi:hypothetical protein